MKSTFFLNMLCKSVQLYKNLIHVSWLKTDMCNFVMIILKLTRSIYLLLGSFTFRFSYKSIVKYLIKYCLLINTYTSIYTSIFVLK